MNRDTDKKQAYRIPVGVSSCLLGNKVRYDGGHKYNATIMELLSQYFELIPICPEVGAGMAIPRPPIQLVEQQGQLHAVGVDNLDMDVTDVLTDYVRQVLEEYSQLCGFIFKARSPSCGVDSTYIFGTDGNPIRKGSGIFAGVVQSQNPDFPVVEEGDLEDKDKRKIFIDQVSRYYKLRRA